MLFAFPASLPAWFTRGHDGKIGFLDDPVASDLLCFESTGLDKCNNTPGCDSQRVGGLFRCQHVLRRLPYPLSHKKQVADDDVCGFGAGVELEGSNLAADELDLRLHHRVGDQCLCGGFDLLDQLFGCHVRVSLAMDILYRIWYSIARGIFRRVLCNFA